MQLKLTLEINKQKPNYIKSTINTWNKKNVHIENKQLQAWSFLEKENLK